MGLEGAIQPAVEIVLVRNYVGGPQILVDAFDSVGNDQQLLRSFRRWRSWLWWGWGWLLLGLPKVEKGWLAAACIHLLPGAAIFHQELLQLHVA